MSILYHLFHRVTCSVLYVFSVPSYLVLRIALLFHPIILSSHHPIHPVIRTVFLSRSFCHLFFPVMCSKRYCLFRNSSIIARIIMPPPPLFSTQSAKRKFASSNFPKMSMKIFSEFRVKKSFAKYASITKIMAKSFVIKSRTST
jgi:hypothetical protein